MRALVLSLAIASLAGCSEAAPSSATSDIGGALDASVLRRDPFDAAMYTSASLELGTGLEAWQSVAPTGDRVELVHGPQGGYHILGRYRFEGFMPDVFAYFRVTPVEGGAPVNTPTVRLHRTSTAGLTRVGSGYQSTYAELVIFTQISFPAEVVGHRFVWELVLEEVSTGRYATTQREITVVDDVP